MTKLSIILASVFFISGCSLKYTFAGVPASYTFWNKNGKKVSHNDSKYCRDNSVLTKEEKNRLSDLFDRFLNLTKSEEIEYYSLARKEREDREKCLYNLGYRWKPDLIWCLYNNSETCKEMEKYRK